MGQKLEIRGAVRSDALVVLDMWNRLIRETSVTFNSAEKPLAEVEEVIATRPFLVAVEGGQVLGYASYNQFRGGVGYRHTVEHSIQLVPGGRGRGMGRALMEALFDVAREEGIHSMWAGVSGENPAGVAFHAALGFDRVAVLPEVGFKFGRWMDLVLMQKRL